MRIDLYMAPLGTENMDITSPPWVYVGSKEVSDDSMGRPLPVDMPVYMFSAMVRTDFFERIP